jgi:hypothetical protein
MLYNPLSGDLRHVFIGLVHTLPAPIAQREGDRLGQVARIGGVRLSSAASDIPWTVLGG